MKSKFKTIDTNFDTLRNHEQVRRLFFKTNIKILLVVDSAIGLGDQGFDLGKVIDFIDSNEFYPCADFTIHSARRTTATPSINQNASIHQFRYLGFRFDMPGFDINNYHQVWFFGFNPGNDGSSSDNSINQATESPLTNNELKILGTWMDTQNGGVLAMGDHHYLGASMCSKIPRVRNMRRWTNAQAVPPIDGFLRHDTNNPAPYLGPIPFDAQSDNVPQKIEVLKKVYSGQLIFRKNFVPHPILCGADGVIDLLPDHPHEGETLGNRFDSGTGGSPVDTSKTTGIPGYNVAEYPAGINGNSKPEPQIIALGHPFNDSDHEKNQKLNNPGHANETTAFGLISVYDGEMAGVGRIVVDSTWHHWLNVNLEGFDPTSSHYRKIRNYFKNVAVWLSNKTLRSHMLFCSLWDYLVIEFDPMRFSIKDSIWYLGEQAKNVLGKIASQCTVTDWVFDLLFVEKQKYFRFPPGPDPCLSCPPFEILEIAVLGGIMKSLYPLVEKYRLEGKIQRLQIDEGEIIIQALQGVRLGQKEYIHAFQQSKKVSDQMLREIPKAIRDISPEEFILRLDKKRLHIQVDSLIFRDELIPVILNEGGHRLVFKLSVNGISLGENQDASVINKLEYTTNKDFLFIKQAKVNISLLKDTFEDGEELLIELFLIPNDINQNDNRKVWSKKFTGPPSNWIGEKQFHQDANEGNVSAMISVSKME